MVIEILTALTNVVFSQEGFGFGRVKTPAVVPRRVQAEAPIAEANSSVRGRSHPSEQPQDVAGIECIPPAGGVHEVDFECRRLEAAGSRV